MSSAAGDGDEGKRMQLARRLREAREYVGLSQEEVAFALEISRPAVGNIEAGIRKVEAIELDKLSALYGRTVGYFLAGEVQPEDKHVAFLARAIKGLSEQDMDELTRFATFLRNAPKSKTTRPSMSKRDDLLSAARRASEILDEFEVKKRIASGYTRVDAELIAGASDVVVLYRKLEQLLGGFLREGGTPGIIVNWDRPRGLVHMTCAHELGHFALGHESTSDTTVDVGQEAELVEQTANQFAYSLLAPAWLVAATMRQKRWGRNDLRNPAIVYQLSLRLGMSYKAMVWSLVRLGHLAILDAFHIVEKLPISLKRDALNGKAPNESKKDIWILNASDRDRILEPSIGDQFVFELPNHAGSGHLWSIDEVQSEGFALQPFVHDASVEPLTVKRPIVVGGNGKPMRYELTTQLATASPHVRSNGEDMVRLASRQRLIAVQEVVPWRPELDASDCFSLSAEFEELKGGFPQSERDRRLAESRRT